MRSRKKRRALNLLAPQQNKHNVLLCRSLPIMSCSAEVGPFLWYKYSYQEQVQGTNLSLNPEKAGPHEAIPTTIGRKRKKSGNPPPHCPPPHTPQVSPLILCLESPISMRLWPNPEILLYQAPTSGSKMPSPPPSARTVQSFSKNPTTWCPNIPI